MTDEKVGLKKVIEVLQKKKYKIFLSDEKPCNLNIIGIRNNNSEVDKFNDWLILFWRRSGIFYLGAYPITTLPGKYYLINKLLNKKGAAILVPGQYQGAYQIRKHRGKYDALVQVKPVKVYRDGNKDYKFDFVVTSIDTGLFGMNIHRAYKKGKAPKVGRTSAGCQVFQCTKDFHEFMHYCHSSSDAWGNSFTYTLLEEDDFINE